MQSAAVLGIYGLTLCAVLIFALPPVLWAEAPAGAAGRRAQARGACRRRRCRLLVAAALRPAAPGAGAAGDRAGRQDPHRAAERAAAGEVAPREPGAHLPRSSRPVGHQCRRRDRRPGRHHACGLAGGRHAVPAARPSRRARRHRPPAAAGHAPDHRRAAGRAGAARRRRGRGASSTACWCSARAARWSRSTTRSTSCRSASTCRCRRCSRRSACSS